MKRFIQFQFCAVIFLSLFFGFKMYPQSQLQWVAGFQGNSNTEIGQTIFIDATDNVFTTGQFSGTVDFDPGSSVSSLTANNYQEIFVSKLDANGNFVWAKQMGGAINDGGFDIGVDSSGNIYILGVFSGTADFDPGSSTFSLTSDHLLDTFICKLDSSGNFIWAKKLRSIDNGYGLSLTMDASDNIYITGFFENQVDLDPDPTPDNFFLISNGFRDVYVAKYDSNGSFIWGKQIGGPGNETGYSIEINASGNVFLSGEFEQTVDFNPDSGISNLTSFGGLDAFVAKLDSNGNFILAKQFGGTGDDSGFSVSLDGSGNIHTTGYFEGNADFDPSSASSSLNSSGGTDVFVSKLDASGNFLWAKGFGGNGADFTTSSALDSSGNIHITGLFEGTVDFDPGSGTSNLTSAGNSDFFVSKLEPSGNFLWAEGFGGSGSDTANSIELDNSGNIHVTGVFGGTVDFDPGSGTSNLVSAGSSDVFVLKLKENLGIMENSFSNISIYPNPTSQNLNISSPVPMARVSVYGLLGRKILEVRPYDLTAVLNLEALVPGMYIVEIVAGGKTLTRKIVKE